MNKRRATVACAWLAMLSIAACGGGAGTSGLDWSVTFECDGDREQTQTVTLSILEGGCGQGGEVVYSAEIRRGETAPGSDALKPGEYAFKGEARRGDTVLAAGCVNAELPADQSITVPLASQVGCVNADAGNDAGADAGGDAGSDAGNDAGSDAGCAFDMCGSDCSDLQTDEAHCGTCEVACTGGECTEGVCECAEGRTHCGGDCVDTQTNAAHCGECDDPCAVAGELCNAGVCECPIDQTVCDDGEGGQACSDLQTDNENCGACGFACPGDAQCTSGRCEKTEPDACTYCTLDGCVDRQTDEAHCGECGRQCPGGTQCVAGDCVCNSGTLCSPGEPLADRSCVNTNTDLQHCGGCDNPCGSACAGGLCGCPQGQTECGADNCVSLQNSNANCGACGRACPGQHTCTNGACRPNDAPAACTLVHSNATGSDYLLCEASVGWGAARTACREYGQDESWDLVTLTGSGATFSAEQDLLAGEATLIGSGLRWWLGGRDSGDSCEARALCFLGGDCSSSGSPTFYWIAPGNGTVTAGTAFCTGNGTCAAASGQTTNWASGEPNNAGCGSGCSCDPDEDCVEMGSSGTWNDATCSESKSYICESRF